ncbi:MAG: surface lipoprotein assembly modifier [Burkholderiaceae bacterium]
MKKPQKTYSRPAPRLLAGLLLAAALLPGAAHAVVDDAVKNGLAMADKGQGKEAYAMLEPLEASRAGDPDFDTVFGIAANQAGEYTRAIFALERVLAVQPDNARARAEMGRALFAVGDFKGARAALSDTKAQGVPSEAALTIDQFLQAIDAAEAAGRSSVRGYVEFGFGHDSNANSGPAITTVAVPALGGLPLTISPGGVEQSAGFATLGAGFSGRYVIDPRWSVIGNVSGNWRGHSGSADQFDIFQVDGAIGGSYRVERNEFSLVLNAGTYEVDHRRLRDQVGFTGEWTYRIDNFRQVNTYLQYSQLSYPGQNLRDVDRTVAGASYAHQFRDNGLILFAGGYVGQEDPQEAGVPHLGHDLYGVRVGAQFPFSNTLAIFGAVGYEHRKFGGTDPLFLATRKDNQANLNIGLSWVPVPKWRVTPQLSFTRVNSNVPIADFDKTVFSITARREF